MKAEMIEALMSILKVLNGEGTPLSKSTLADRN